MLRRVFASRVAVAVFTAIITGCTVGVVTNGFGWQDNGPEIRACVGPTGLVRIVPSHAACRHGEHAIEWNQQGPPGSAGAQGAQGPQGPAGPPGASAPVPRLKQYHVNYFYQPHTGFIIHYGYCPEAGMQLISGGYQASTLVHVTSSTPNIGLNRWEVLASNVSEQPDQLLEIDIVCVDSFAYQPNPGK